MKSGAIPEFAGEVSGRTIFECIREGRANQELTDTVHRWIAYIADGIVSFVHIFNPSMVLIGGGVSEQEELFIEPLRRLAFEKMMPCYREGLSIERAVLGNRAGFAGAVFLCLQEGL